MPTQTQSMEPVYQEIGRRLRWLREQRGWTAQVFGKIIDVHPSTLVAWENAIARVGVAEVLRLTHALGVPVAAVLADLDIDECKPLPGTREKRRQTALKRVEAMRVNGKLGIGARTRAKDGKGTSK